MASVMDNPSNFESSAYTSSLPAIDKNDLTCVKRLGAGGFGIVYKANHKHWDLVAVKVCKWRMSDDSMKRVHREVERMLRTSKHDYIVQIRGIIPSDLRTNCCIVMEYMEHGSLHSFQRRIAKFPDAVKIRMIYEISLGMNFLHTLPKPIIHRDLKLENVFVSKGFTAKVGDLGLATWCTASDYKEHAGTITHIAPENLKNINHNVTTKYDVYSFGIMLWEFATGKQPFENCHGNNDLIELGVKGGQRPNRKDIPANEPDIVRELIEEAWHHDPDHRPAFQEIKERIREKYDAEYAVKYNQDLADLYVQLQLKESVPQDTTDDGSHKFPWEQGSSVDIPDSPSSFTKSGIQIDFQRMDRARVTPTQQDDEANDDPQPLLSTIVPVKGTKKSEVKGHPVSVSDDQQEGILPGVSGIIEQMKAIKVQQQEGEKYGIDETMPPGPSTQEISSNGEQDKLHRQSLATDVTGRAPPVGHSKTIAIQPSDAHLGQAHYGREGEFQTAKRGSGLDASWSAHPDPNYGEKKGAQSFTPTQQKPPLVRQDVILDQKTDYLSGPWQINPSKGHFEQVGHGNSQSYIHPPLQPQPQPYVHPTYGAQPHQTPQNVSSPMSFTSNVPQDSCGPYGCSPQPGFGNQPEHYPHPHEWHRGQAYQQQLSYSNRHSYPPHVSNPDEFRQPAPKDGNANPISISITGNKNVVTVAYGKSTVKTGKKSSKKKKKHNRRAPSSSSEDSSEDGACEVDSVAADPSVTTSQAPVTENDISRISEYIGKKYKKLGRALGLTNAQIENIEMDHYMEGREEMAVQIMLKWKRRVQRSEVTHAALAEVLVDIGLRDVALML